MKAFPFTVAEWAAVNDATLRIINATLADDPVLRSSCFVRLMDVLDGLRARYGNHPVLLETEAEFIENYVERIALYHRAVGIAEANGLPTLSIRLSLAQALLDSGQPGAARELLLVCESGLYDGNESEWALWMKLMTALRRAEPLNGLETQ